MNAYVAKKCYFRQYDKELKTRFKGVQIKDSYGSKIYSEEEIIDMGCFRFTKDNKNVVFINEIDSYDRGIILQKLFNDESKSLSVKSNLLRFIDQQLNGKRSYVICSSL